MRSEQKCVLGGRWSYCSYFYRPAAPLPTMEVVVTARTVHGEDAPPGPPRPVPVGKNKVPKAATFAHRRTGLFGPQQHGWVTVHTVLNAHQLCDLTLPVLHSGTLATSWLAGERLMGAATRYSVLREAGSQWA